MKSSKNRNINLLNSDMFVPTKLCIVSRLYLLVGALLHVVCVILYVRTGMKLLALLSCLYIVAFMVCFFIFNTQRLRYIYMFILCIIEIYIIYHIYIFGWEYNFFMYSFMLIPLCILTSITPSEKRYNVKYPIVFFVITHLVMLILRLRDLICGGSPLVEFTGRNHMLYEKEAIVVYATASLASFVLIFAFLLDLNTAFDRVNRFNAELKYSATHDALTGLINRRSIGEKLNKAYATYKEDNTKFCIIMCDIDDFKKINDTYGHNVGDKVLKKIANIMLLLGGAPDCVCRWGGEEMLIVTPYELQKSCSLAENIRKTIENTEFLDDKKERMKVTVTIGVSEINKDISVEKLIDMADDNLYKGKNLTKNCVVA